MTSNLHSHYHQPAKGRRLTACHRHPDEPFTSLCAACLRERLSLLNPPPASASTSASADQGGGSSSAAGAAALPQLRRCRTFSAKRCESLGLTGEPRRRSCEVRARNTLEDLFAADEEDKGADGAFTAKSDVGSRNPGLLRGTFPVPELREEEHDESDSEIRVSTDVIVPNNVCERNADEEEDIENSKTMKEFIDLELKGSKKPARRDLKEIAGTFRIAASVFSRKLQKWKRKQQKIGRPDCDYDKGGGGGGMSTGRRFRDTQSEVGEYRSGRRSYDTDPRVSIDLSRASIDGERYSVDGIRRRFDDADPRCSLDLGRASVDCGRMFVEEERCGYFVGSRASCDGYMNGKPIPQGTTPMVSVIENAMAAIYGFDNRELVAKKLNMENRERRSSSGYRHLDSLSLLVQKKGFDRSNSKRNDRLAREEDGEMQPASCSKKLPGEVKLFRDAKLLITEKELMGSRMSSLKDDSSDSLDTASKDMTSSASSSSSSNNGFHKTRRWGKFLSIWPLLSRGKHLKSAEEGKFDSSKKIEREGNREANPDPRWKLVRSSSVASSRSFCTMAATAHGIRAETEARFLSLKRRENGILARHSSSGYSASSVDDGMLRFYLTPLRSYRRSKYGRSRLSKSRSLAQSEVNSSL